jgi:protein-L-isoaspartate O-methyltransferase
MSVIDIGSGKGFLASKLATVASDVTCVEIDYKSVEYSKKTHHDQRISDEIIDVFNYHPKKKFDACVLSNVLEHIDDRLSLLVKIKQFSNYLLIRIPSIERDWVTLYKKNNGMEWRSDQTHYIEYTKTEIFEELSAAGWQVIDFDTKWGEYYIKCIH